MLLASGLTPQQVRLWFFTRNEKLGDRHPIECVDQDYWGLRGIICQYLQ